MALLLLALGLGGCSGDEARVPEAGAEVPGADHMEVLGLKKDRARYAPGETVEFSVERYRPNVWVRYKSLGETLGEEPMAGERWSWQPPAADFRGYMVELIERDKDKESVLGSVAVDVSSDWTKFPRYGFLSRFGPLSQEQRSAVLEHLKDFHINGIQFYDRHAKHHFPLPLVPGGEPLPQWRDFHGPGFCGQPGKDRLYRALSPLLEHDRNRGPMMKPNKKLNQCP